MPLFWNKAKPIFFALKMSNHWVLTQVCFYLHKACGLSMHVACCCHVATMCSLSSGSHQAHGALARLRPVLSEIGNCCASCWQSSGRFDIGSQVHSHSTSTSHFSFLSELGLLPNTCFTSHVSSNFNCRCRFARALLVGSPLALARLLGVPMAARACRDHPAAAG